MRYICCFLILFCFESLATDTKFGDWAYFESKDRMTDKISYFIYSYSLDDSSTIYFNCNKFMIIHSDTNMNERLTYPEVKLRVDKENYIQFLFYSTGKYTAVPKDISVKIFDYIKNGKELLIEVENPSFEEYYTYSLKGITKAYNRLQQECKNQ